MTDAEYVSSSILYNEAVDELISHGYKYGEKSKLGAPIYIIKDRGLKHYIEYQRKICEIDKRFFGDDNFQDALIDVFDKPVGFATLVSKACIVNGEYNLHRLKYAVILNYDGVCGSVQKKNVLYHEIGHCINDDPYYKHIADGKSDGAKESDSVISSIPKTASCVVSECNEGGNNFDDKAGEFASCYLNSIKDGMDKEIKADFYAYSKTRTFLDTKNISLGFYKGLRTILSVNEDLFNHVLTKPECLEVYSDNKNLVFTDEGKQEFFSTHQSLYGIQIDIRKLGVKYLMENKTLDGFDIFEKIKV